MDTTNNQLTGPYCPKEVLFIWALPVLTLLAILAIIIRSFSIKNRCPPKDTTSNLHLTTPPLSSSSSPPTSWDVFLSFYGKDTRRNFIANLYFSLDQAGIQTFRDDPSLEKGEEISKGLHNAIRSSNKFVVVISENYARSPWCLDELVEILDCKRTNTQVVPVFYYVNPSDLRHLRGSFREALDFHKKLYPVTKIKKWRSALAEISDLSGYTLKKDADENESDTIQEIVENVALQVSTKVLHLEECLFGVDSAVEKIYKKVNIKSDDFCTIGLWGMGGIGKTTTAKAFFNKYSKDFDISCFVENVIQNSKGSNPLVSLLEQLLSELLKRKDYKVPDVERGTRLLKQILSSKKALVVLDDLDQSNHSELLVWICNLFSDGSRIIVTTRDVNLLYQLRVDISKVYIYKVKKLSPEESLELFNCHAFRKATPPENLRELSVKIVDYVEGLPLALKVLGSSLRGRTDVSFWKAQLQKVRVNPEIQNILKLSYDGLGDKTEKALFLDIVFFFIGKDKDEGAHVFRSCNFCPEAGIPILLERCLITIDKNNTFQMHALIQDMGKDVILEESKHGKAKRLYLSNGNPCHALQNLEGTDTVEGLILINLSMMERHVSAKIFERFLNLRLLEIIGALDIKGNFENSFHELRCIRWSHCPWTHIPISFRPRKLISLIMPFNKFKTLPKGITNLKTIDFSYSKNLKIADDFRDVRLVDKLLLNSCHRLLKIHPSIEQLTTLSHLDLGECNNLKELPEHVGRLNKLGHFDLRDCQSLKRLPEAVKNLTSLSCLNMSGCHSLKQLPEQLGNLKGLKMLNLSHTSIEQLPDTIAHLKELIRLEIMGCKKLLKLPEQLGDLRSLKVFDATYCAIEQLPDSFSNLTDLVDLQLPYCENLTSLPNSMWNLKMLEELNLEGCKNLERLPEQLGMMQRLQHLDATGTAVEEIPGSIGLLSRLKILNCRWCEKLEYIPNSIRNILSLEILDLMDSGLSAVNLLDTVKNMKWKGLSLHLSLRCDIKLLLPVILDISSLESLSLTDEGESFFSTKPFSLSKLFNLQFLELVNCRSLGSSFPEVPPNLRGLTVGNYATLEQLPDLSGLKQLKRLSMWNCSRLQTLPPLPPHLFLLYVYDCSSLQDLPDLSMFKELELLMVQKCRNLESINLKQSSVQVGLKSSFEADPPNTKIAEWFSYKSNRCTISFDIPPNLGDNFLGVALWFVFRFKTDTGDPVVRVVVRNETEGCQLNYITSVSGGTVRSRVECIRRGVISVGSTLQYMMKEPKSMPMKSGDRIKVSFHSILSYFDEFSGERACRKVKVEKCGAHVIQKTPSLY
ncbi:disease resistance protein RPV1 [Daucus carota subsp. sativus]|uniref:disease resistance protein RPV1 n=1 Tax=Daucus carota subsp. sativus TaxID=79200 RepID=UPI003082F25A